MPRPAPRPPRPAAYEREGLPTWAKVLIGTSLGLVGFGALGFIALTIYAPVDLVRDRLIREVRERTGRDLIISGRPSISLWPDVAVSLGAVSLSNPAGVAGPPLVQMRGLEATVKLWPLLSKQVVVDRLVLRQPVADLRVTRDGRRNWDFAEALGIAPLVQYAQAGGGAAPMPRPELRPELRSSSRSASGESQAVSLGNVTIVDGAVRYADERTGAADMVSGIDMTLSAPDVAGPLAANGQLTWQHERITLGANVMPFAALVSRGAAQTSLQVSSSQGQFAYTGNASFSDAAKGDGTVTVKSASLAKLSQWLGRPIVGTTSAAPVDVQAKVTFSPTDVRLNDAVVTAFGHKLNGNIAIATSGARPRITGAVKVAELDLDAIATIKVLEPIRRAPIPAAVAPPAAPAKRAEPQSIEDLLKASEPKVKPQVRGFTQRAGWSEDVIDVSALGLADADLKLSADRVKSGAMTTGAVIAGVQMTGGQNASGMARLTIDDWALFEGKVRGVVTIDGTKPAPAMTANLTLDGIAIQSLTRALGQPDLLEGRGVTKIALAGAGRSEKQIVDNLSGKVELMVPRGAVLGYSVDAMIAGVGQGRMPNLIPTSGARTDFTDFGATFDIVQGIARNQDLRAKSSRVTLAGAGQIQLGARQVDYTLKPRVVGAVQMPSGFGGAGVSLSNVEVPVRITGSFDKITATPELGGILRNPSALVDTVKQLDKREVEDTVKGIIGGDGASKAKARDFLNNLLKKP